MSKRRPSPETPEPGPSKRHKRDKDEEDAEEEESGALNASQRPDFVYNATMAEEAEVGIIERMQLKNFMCHTRLEFNNFCPQVNFIIGNNGSGKSAVVTALVIGLGGKTSLTSRGSSMKSLIKHSKRTAEIQIRLRNRGPDAYKHNEYGDAINVERVFTVDGGSQYRLKSKDGKLISNKREELNHILDQFNIQVDNPVAILNQETSKNFLHSKSPDDKYKFFLKATQLEQMKHDYALANTQKDITEEIINRKQETLPLLKKEVLEWEQKYKALSSIEELRKKVQRLKEELAWSHVVAKEKEVEPIAKQLKQLEAGTPKFVQKVEESQRKVEANLSRHQQTQEQLKALSEEVQKLQPLHEEAKRSVQDAKKAHRNAVMDMRRVKNEYDSVEKERNDTLERIKEITNTAQHDYEEERQARERQIQGLMEKVNGLKAQQRTTEHQAEQFRLAVGKYKEDSYRLRAEEKDVGSRLEKSKRHLRDLESSRSNRLKRFGGWVPDLLEKIEIAHKRGQFHEKPRGPFGAFIEPRDPKWSLAVETVVKSYIHSFCCTDHHDERVLDKLMSQVIRHGRKPSVIVSRFQHELHDVSRHRAQSDRYQTVMDAIVINDPVIGNALIDQRGIESVILIENAEEARHVMRNSVPRNCKEAFTIKGDQIYHRPTFRYYSNDATQSQFLTCNVEEDIRRCSAEIRNLQQEQASVQRASQNLNEQIKTNKMEERKTDTQLMKIREAISKCNYEITDLRSVEDPTPVDVTTLEEDVQNCNEQLVALRQQQQQSEENQNRAKAELQEAETDFKEKEQKIRGVADKVDPLKEELGRAEMDIEKAKSHKKHYEGKMKEHEKDIRNARRDLEQKQKEVEDDTQKAERVCERQRTKRSPQNLSSEIEQINKRIATEEKNRGNPEEITNKYHETSQAYEKIQREVRLQQAFIKTMDRIMVTRMQQYYQFRQLIALRVKYFFVMMLSNRQYSGKISFDHKLEKLSLSVQPTTTSNGEGSKDMKALSGGERSFTTVCFILALWDAMESPFRCLDEFDVFMDMVNRRISMDMMLEAARQQKARQFIFLTPQDMSSLKVSKNLKIFKMADPDRGQGVLPFEAVSQN